MSNSQKGFAPVLVLIGLIIVLVLIIGSYFLFQLSQNNFGQKNCFSLNEEQCKNRPDCSPDHLPGIRPNFYCQNKAASASKPPVACTQEAKICPDGIPVGRTGSNCEFSPCPTVTQIAVEEKDCGGFAGETGQMACSAGYYCKYPIPMYPDASGKCTKK